MTQHNREIKDTAPVHRWFSRPEMLVGLSALLLSLCGLFISIYEASLIRKAQRASVWPHVEVAASITNERIRIWLQNTGVGPARIRAAAVVYNGKTLANWPELLHALAGEKADSLTTYQSLINGRVMPSNSSRETIFSITRSSDITGPEVLARLQEALLQGELDVIVCYCSVYNECWTVRLQDVFERTRRPEHPRGSSDVKDCDSAKTSGI